MSTKNCNHAWVTHCGERALVWQFCRMCKTVRSAKDSSPVVSKRKGMKMGKMVTKNALHT